MTTIGVLSDTHLRQFSPEQRQTLNQHLRGVDILLHAGDATGAMILETLPVSSVLAVRGNCDDYALSQRLPDKLVTEAAGFRIGLIHGWGPPDGLAQRVAACFEDVHCIVFGHSHQPYNQIHDGVLFFNPGSFYLNRDGSGRGSLGLLTADKTISGRIILL